MNNKTSDTPETDKFRASLDGMREINQRDRLLSHARKLERERDRMQALAGELIAMIRVNVMRGTFDGVTIEQMDEHLNGWVERLKSK